MCSLHCENLSLSDDKANVSHTPNESSGTQCFECGLNT